MMMDESRLEFLEGQVQEQSRNWDRLFGEVGRLDLKIDAFGGTLSARIDGVEHRLDAKIDAFDVKLDRKIDAVDQKLDRKIDDLRAEMTRQFRWTIGTLVTLFGLTLTLGAGVATALLTNP